MTGPRTPRAIDWNRPHPRVVADQRRAAAMDQADIGPRDANGMAIGPILDRFTADELDAARRLARLHGHRHDLVSLDPANTGWRFIRDAVVALGGKDPGRSPYTRLRETYTKRASS